MAEPDQPQIYLITPPQVSLASFPDQLARVLDTVPVACLRLALAETDASAISHAADTLRAICHARDIPLVIERHLLLVEKLGLDGVHLTDGARSVRKTRKALGTEAIIGAFCATSRHDGLNAGEAGADYVSFGPVGESPLGDGSRAEPALFEWWSEMIELPVVAEGGLTPALVEALAPITDFLAVGPEIWAAEQPETALLDLLAPIR